MSARVERLVNLTIALLEARRPLSLAELRARTGYYTQADAESGRRMFERDKDELRRLGVPVETRPVPLSDDVGYLVPRDAYELPDVDLTSEEVAALALAVRLTGTEGTPLALAKLAARAPDPGQVPDAPATRVALPTEPVDAVADAVLQRRRLTFEYRRADGRTSLRRLDPYGIVRRRAAWYLVGHDHDREAVRAFRLDRLLGPPRVEGPPGAFEVPEDLDVVAAARGPEAAGVDVVLEVAPSATWSAQLRGGRPVGTAPDGWQRMELTALQPVRDRSWLLGLGADVRVVAPPALRDQVLGALQRVAAAHAPARSGGSPASGGGAEREPSGDAGTAAESADRRDPP